MRNSKNMNCKYKTTGTFHQSNIVLRHNIEHLPLVSFVSKLPSIFFEGDSTIEHQLEKTKEHSKENCAP
jgi:hypothetical protein